VYGLSGARFVRTPAPIHNGLVGRYVRQLSRYSAAFSFLSDVTMLIVGGELKRKEKLSARLGDALSQLYLGSATVKRFVDQGLQKDDEAFFEWSMQDAMQKIEVALDGVLANYPNRLLGALLRRVVFPLGLSQRAPSDKLGARVVAQVIAPTAARERLTEGTFIGHVVSEPMRQIEDALTAVMQLEAIEQRLKPHFKSGALAGERPADWLPTALKAQWISQAEMDIIQGALHLTDEVIKVDDFSMDFGLREYVMSLNDQTMRYAA
jgi:acyl-CoA dehydrogenase